jgi:hypothetical protein
LDYLTQSLDPSCIVIQLTPHLECHIRAKIDPMNQHKGCLIIIRLKTEANLTALQERQMKMESTDTIEIDRDLSLIQAVELMAKNLTEKYHIK